MAAKKKTPAPAPAAEVQEAATTVTMRVDEPRGLHLRESPGGTPLAVLKNGTRVEVTGPTVTDRSGIAWLPVTAAGHQTGYVQSRYLR